MDNGSGSVGERRRSDDADGSLVVRVCKRSKVGGEEGKKDEEVWMMTGLEVR